MKDICKRYFLDQLIDKLSESRYLVQNEKEINQSRWCIKDVHW